MNKLPNEVTNLSTFLMPDGTPLKSAKLYKVSRFWSHKRLGDTSIDDLLAAEFKLQETAVSAGLIKPGAELQPNYAKEILEDRTEKAYTVIAITVRERGTPLGYKVVGMVRPDVVAAGGEHYVKLWFTPIVHPGYVGARARAGKKKGGPLPQTLDSFLMYTAVSRAMDLENRKEESVVGNDPLVFADDQGSMKGDELRAKYGFKVLIDNVGVPDLAAKGHELYRKVYEATLLVKPNEAHGSRIPLSMAIEMAKDYQQNGFGVPLTARIVKDATRRLEEKAAGTGYVQLT